MTKHEVQLTVREFAPGDEAAFQRLNEEWIVRYFTLEAKDVGMLTDPKNEILDPGGRILFAERNGELIGCCALIAMGPGEFEVAKMAVTERARGLGAGKLLLGSTIELARMAGARRLFLETNRKLGTAIHLYESMGFRHLRPGEFQTSPYARADVHMALDL